MGVLQYGTNVDVTIYEDGQRQTLNGEGVAGGLDTPALVYCFFPMAVHLRDSRGFPCRGFGRGGTKQCAFGVPRSWSAESAEVWSGTGKGAPCACSTHSSGTATSGGCSAPLSATGSS